LEGGIKTDEKFDSFETAQAKVFFKVSVGAFAAQSFFAGGTFEFVEKLGDDGENETLGFGAGCAGLDIWRGRSDHKLTATAKREAEFAEAIMGGAAAANVALESVS